MTKEAGNQSILKKLCHSGEDSTLLEHLGEQIWWRLTRATKNNQLFGAESYINFPTIHGGKIALLFMSRVL